MSVATSMRQRAGSSRRVKVGVSPETWDRVLARAVQTMSRRPRLVPDGKTTRELLTLARKQFWEALRESFRREPVSLLEKFGTIVGSHRAMERTLDMLAFGLALGARDLASSALPALVDALNSEGRIVRELYGQACDAYAGECDKERRRFVAPSFEDALIDLEQRMVLLQFDGGYRIYRVGSTGARRVPSEPTATQPAAEAVAQ